MAEITPFNDHSKEYEAWFKKYPHVFKSEVAALKRSMPKGKNSKGIEVGLASGRFAKALGKKKELSLLRKCGNSLKRKTSLY